MMVANGLLLVPGLVSTPFVATYQAAAAFEDADNPKQKAVKTILQKYRLENWSDFKRIRLRLTSA
jgi:hypothetical protein